MTPGPTQVRENVRLARSQETTNPDLDPAFYLFYEETCNRIASFLKTTNPVYILSGEGILGLEAACASLTQPADRVLILDNGLFGHGFADFVRLYGGEPVFFTSDYDAPLSVEAIAQFLKQDHQFRYATMVHCDTPTGVCNPVEQIGRLLHEYGIISVVDAVSSMFGEPLQVDRGQLDIVCGASQKALSAPIGLTFVSVSDRAKEIMNKRTVPIASFYCNLTLFQNYKEEQWFPYSMPISDIMGLRIAIDNVLEEGDAIFDRHQKMASAIRNTLQRAGLSLYLRDGYANTVTVFLPPDGLRVADILQEMQTTHQILLAGCFGILKDQVIRIGHMGENANQKDLEQTMAALGKTLCHLGCSLEVDLREIFLQELHKK